MEHDWETRQCLDQMPGRFDRNVVAVFHQCSFTALSAGEGFAESLVLDACVPCVTSPAVELVAVFLRFFVSRVCLVRQLLVQARMQHSRPFLCVHLTHTMFDQAILTCFCFIFLQVGQFQTVLSLPSLASFILSRATVWPQYAGHLTNSCVKVAVGDLDCDRSPSELVIGSFSAPADLGFSFVLTAFVGSAFFFGHS